MILESESLLTHWQHYYSFKFNLKFKLNTGTLTGTGRPGVLRDVPVWTLFLTMLRQCCEHQGSAAASVSGLSMLELFFPASRTQITPYSRSKSLRVS